MDDFPEQFVYGTADGTESGASEALSLGHMDDLLSRQKGDPFQVMYMNRETWVAYKGVLNAQPGNTASMIMNELFGMNMLHHDGTPIVMNDAVGMDLDIGAAAISTDAVASDTVTVTDPGFLGFRDLNVGETITLGGETAEVVSITDTHTVKVDPGSASGGWSNGTDLSGKVEQQNAVYACRFDAVDGISAVYHQNRGVPANPGEYYGPVAGFDAEDLGLERDKQAYQTRLDAFLQNVVHDPRAVARLSGFDVA